MCIWQDAPCAILPLSPSVLLRFTRIALISAAADTYTDVYVTRPNVILHGHIAERLLDVACDKRAMILETMIRESFIRGIAPRGVSGATFLTMACRGHRFRHDSLA